MSPGLSTTLEARAHTNTNETLCVQKRRRERESKTEGEKAKECEFGWAGDEPGGARGVDEYYQKYNVYNSQGINNNITKNKQKVSMKNSPIIIL